MDRPNRAILTGFLAAVLAVLAGVSLARGGLYIGKHEGDTLHLLQIVMRMAGGEWPHLDFMTPIGVLAMLPIVVFVKAGIGAGHAIILGQVLVAAALFPAIWWVSYSRFRGGLAYLFAGAVLVLILALVHGEAERSVSISMHYNRWAWALSFLVIALAILPDEEGPHPLPDGLVVGLGMAALGLIKVTYFAAFALPVLVALAGRGAWRTLAWAIAAGLAVGALVTLVAGPAFWAAYLGDLLSVARSEVRPNPGLPLGSVIGAPAYIGGSLLVVLSVILLRQAGRALEGLVMLLLVPGFFYVTYQNYGNDPQWLGLAGMLMIALVPLREVHNGLGWDLRKGLLAAGIAALALASPSFFNLAYSPFRHLTVQPADYLPVLPGSGVHEDLQIARVRVMRLDAKVALDGPGTPYAAVSDPEMRPDPAMLQGEALAECNLELGAIGWYMSMAQDLKASGLAEGHTVFAADLLSSYWLYGAFEPLPGAAPWYYGGLSGFENADFLIVPLCPLATKVRAQILREIEADGAILEEVRSNEMYRLFRVVRG